MAYKNKTGFQRTPQPALRTAHQSNPRKVLQPASGQNPDPEAALGAEDVQCERVTAQP